MTATEIISLVVTVIGVFSFAAIFTILYGSYTTSQIAELRTGKRDVELINEVIYERQENIARRRKITKIIKNIAFYMVMLILVPLFLFSIANRFMNNKIMLGDKTIMVVASGSMSEKHSSASYLETNNLNNQFNTYDIIILNKVEKASDLKLYDVIAFVNDKGINVIHRIIEIRSDGSYVTRGDANPSNDAYNPTFNDVIGKYASKKIDGLGIIVRFLQSYSGIITVVSLVYCLIMIDRLSEKVNQTQTKRIKQLEEIIDFSNEFDDDAFRAKYFEKIYYQGNVYYLSEDGLISIEKASEEEIKAVFAKKEDGDKKEESLKEKEEIVENKNGE